MDVVVWTGVVAAALSSVFSAVQVAAVVRRGTTAGLSAVSWLMLCCTFAVWLAWGLLRRDAYLVPTNAFALAGAVWVVVRIHTESPVRVRVVAATVAAVGFAFVVQLVAGVAGALLSVFAVTGTIRAYQRRTIITATSIAGVSLMPWAVSSAAQVAWFVHAVAAGKVVVAVHAPFAVATNVALVCSVMRRRASKV
jgi:uncharacterized protein with PQ loop repeat